MHAMRMGPGKHLKGMMVIFSGDAANDTASLAGLELMGGIVKPEEVGLFTRINTVTWSYLTTPDHTSSSTISTRQGPVPPQKIKQTSLILCSSSSTKNSDE